MNRIPVLLAVAALGIGCGDNSQYIPEPGDLDPTVHQIAFLGDVGAVAGGQSVGVIGHIPGLSRLGFEYAWEQLDGPPVVIANNRGSVLAFDMPETDSVGFRLTVTDGDGESISGSITLTPEGVHDGSFVRRDHEVIEGNAVSVRMGRDHALAHVLAQNPELTEDEAHDTINALDRTIEWTQLEGPTVQLDEDNPERILFTAPLVDADTLLVFEVTETIDSITYSDRVLVYVNDDPLVTEADQNVVGLVHAYRPDSPWREAIEECVYSQIVYTVSICQRERLPLLGQSAAGGVPTIDEVLDRVVVSHDWMGERFEEFLRTRDPDGDFLALLSSVTAVVLSYDVRPSFYSSYTAAIYIDPRYVWLTPEERDTLNEAPDYRSAFGGALQFLVLWRYVKDDAYAYTSARSYARVTRTWDDYGYMFARLLYHELAHATDYFPPEVHDTMTGDTYADAYQDRVDNLLSDELTDQYPLTSEEMFGLARVQFRGEDADDTQAGYQPSDVSAFFAPDVATEFYAYNSEREDLAMVFEEAMMTYRYGIERDVAVTDRPEILTSATVLVDWGQRGRVGAAHLAERVQYTVQRVMPELDAAGIVGALAEPWEMRPGESWADNLISQPVDPGARTASPDIRPLELDTDALRERHLQLHGFPYSH